MSQQWQPPQPREAVSVQREMGAAERIGWAIAVMCTLGLALPFYWARKRKLRRTTVTTWR